MQVHQVLIISNYRELEDNASIEMILLISTIYYTLFSNAQLKCLERFLKERKELFEYIK